MIREYHSRGIFNIISIGADKAFDAIVSEIKDEPYNVTLTTCDANYHVEDVERMIRFMKEQIQTVRVAMLYKTIPKRMTNEMVHRVIITAFFPLGKSSQVRNSGVLPSASNSTSKDWFVVPTVQIKRD